MGGLVKPSVPALTPDQIHIWNFSLIGSDTWQGSCEQLLLDDERTRASRFHFEADANRFRIARGTVRAILAAYLLSLPTDLNFVCAKNGKPAIASPKSDLRFNVSHSGDRGLLGVALKREIGVDIEAIRPDVETDKLAERFFSEHERQSLRGIPDHQRIAAFFRCWTCKEAFLKAQGVGLSRSLGSFDVELNPALPARLIATRPDAGEAGQWNLHDIEAPPGYAAATAIEGPITEIKIMNCRHA